METIFSSFGCLVDYHDSYDCCKQLNVAQQSFEDW